METPYDNAQAEAGWSTLKTELLPGGSPFASLEEAYYLDTCFNLDPATSPSTTARPINSNTT